MAERVRRLPEDRVGEWDGVRALLIGLVGWFHIWQQSWLTPVAVIGGRVLSLDFLLRSGYIWVDGMILLSGFLLYLPYALDPGRPMDVKRFCLRRFARIWPSYALNVTVFFLMSLNAYRSAGDAVWDLISHLTFLHPLSFATYYASPINGALWTVGVDVHFYLLFPLVLRFFRKKPLLTAAVMCAAAWGFRLYASGLRDCAMFFNQLPAFLDVYAVGMLGAMGYAALKKQIGQDGRSAVVFTLTALVSVLYLVVIARDQAARNGVEGIRIGQMENRLPIALALTVLIVSLPFAAKGVRKAFSNRVTGFLAAVSYQFYMLHQKLAVLIREWRWIPSRYDLPNQAGDFSWQLPYTLTCFLLALLLSAALTYLFERPLSRKILSSGNKQETVNQ